MASSNMKKTDDWVDEPAKTKPAKKASKPKATKAAKKVTAKTKPERICMNFKVTPYEARLIHKKADEKFKGNLTQLVRAKVLGLKPEYVRKTTRV